MAADFPPRALEVALMYTHTCNITCRHCGILSSPQNKNKMRHEDAIRYIRDAAAIPRFRKVTFTGGEPLLYQDEHAEMLALCKELKLATRIVTNGFWARTVDKGLKVLSRMKDAGLSELNFSADKFHLEFQDAAILRNGLECARQLGMARIVSFVSNADQDPLNLFSEMYGIPRDSLADLRLYMGDLHKMEELKDEKIFVYYGGLIGLGRAADYPEELRYLPLEIFKGGSGCPEVVNKPVIYPDGTFQACCCAGGKMKTFTVGNLHEHSLRELYEKMFSRSQWLFINSYGPKDLYEVVAKARPDLPRKDAYTSICEVCVCATEGLEQDEVDRIVEAESVARMLKALGVKMEHDPDAAPPPAPKRRSLDVIQ